MTVEDVQRLIAPTQLRDPAVLIAGEANLDPMESALERAIRDELLAHEADRRGLGGDSRAARIAALIEDERNATPGLKVSAISDAEALAWYQRNRARIDRVRSADVAWGELDDGAAAHSLLEQLAAGADQDTFLRLVREHGAVTSGTATIDHDGAGANDMVARAAFGVAAAGGVGLAEERGTRGSWLVRVERISFDPATWDDALAFLVKSAMAWEREQDHLTRLADSLRERWPVRVYQDRLTALIAVGG